MAPSARGCTRFLASGDTRARLAPRVGIVIDNVKERDAARQPARRLGWPMRAMNGGIEHCKNKVK
jgi:hypothetical protein